MRCATAALVLATPVFLKLSRAGKLDCDVWLLHLTGEEFPSDCMDARHLPQSLVEGTLKLHTSGKKTPDLSKVKIEGVYVLDMIAHNRDRDVFQISPGLSPQSVWLAYQAHLANMIWDAHAEKWNYRPPWRPSRSSPSHGQPRCRCRRHDAASSCPSLRRER